MDIVKYITKLFVLLLLMCFALFLGAFICEIDMVRQCKVNGDYTTTLGHKLNCKSVKK